MMRRLNQKYAYINHPHNLPLHIDGNSKKRIQPLKKQQFNGEKATINEESRSLLLKKLACNAHDLNNLKSVLPTDDYRRQTRPNSIKIFNDDKENIKSSGIDYLMQRTESLKNSHKGKAQVANSQPSEVKRSEKKHFVSLTIQSNQQDEKASHRKTAEIKLVNDIYSDVYREEKEAHPAKKIQSNNLFKSGEDLGFEKKQQKRMSQNKLVEILGSECLRENKAPLRERRQDWRTSNINFF